jgi:hypothetical protein
LITAYLAPSGIIRSNKFLRLSGRKEKGELLFGGGKSPVRLSFAAHDHVYLCFLDDRIQFIYFPSLSEDP